MVLPYTAKRKVMLNNRKIFTMTAVCHQDVHMPHTVWKFHYFPITQILCEINFKDSRSAKCAILTNWEALNFASYEFLLFLKAEIDQIS